MIDNIFVDYVSQAINILDAFSLKDASGKIINWADKIDLEKLDFSSTRNCILGQIFGSSLDGKIELKMLIGLGFSLCWNGEEWLSLWDENDFSALQRQRWIEAIKERKS